jgi:hypothetical protein
MGLRPMAGDTDDPECLAGLRAPDQTPDARRQTPDATQTPADSIC